MREPEVCWSCVVGLHSECMDATDLDDNLIECCCWLPTASADAHEAVESQGVGRPSMESDQIKDVLSTGRKRALQMAPYIDHMVCEWAYLKTAGGGVVPIMGCRGNVLAATRKNDDLPDWANSRLERHHGPDKNVLNNVPGVNLWRLCSECHHRWHKLNDEFYDDRPQTADVPMVPSSGELVPHDPMTLWDDDEYAEWLAAHRWS